MKLSQIRLITGDIHQSVPFYRDVMEFSLRFYAEEMQFASFHTGETKLEIFSRDQISEVIGEEDLPADVESQSKFLLSFEVEQVDEFYASLKNKGVLFINEPHDRKEWNARVVHLRDPDGNVIELYKHPL
ncbi:VOC family protein [Paenibacillus sp. XY044]|uniref:VOC family protein n=1 Tax=Paenibacillus sp. XY044 TaxID=2026089 RepID=UPI000B982715|nr:VOC family protein [Paenibacillus sp. XY044]OZB94165.1 hypothetical protein CJP46_18310 [Paenibacillus sp. XY044]